MNIITRFRIHFRIFKGVVFSLEVYENNFGWQAGSCRKVKIWKDGELYDGSETKISSDGNSVIFSTVPKANKYYLFGISPAVCLTGHKNHFADYAYLNFDLCSDDKVLFLGIAVRTADGEMYSLNLKNGDKNEESLPVGNSYENYCVCLKNGKRGDGSFLEFTDYQRNNIVQAQFLFMAFSKVTLHIKNITLSDLNLSRAVENNIENNTERNDIKLSR